MEWVHPPLRFLCTNSSNYSTTPRQKNVKFLRMGTCGGLGVKPGTLILTKSGYDGCLEPGIEFIALGQKKRYPANADPTFLSELESTLIDMEVPYAIGNTMTCNDFYETQGR